MPKIWAQRYYTGAGSTIALRSNKTGADAAGKRRFLSSRKTVNGPTMADLGGASVLDGTGTYASTLHTVHRI